MMRTMTMGLRSYPFESRKYTFQVMLKDSSVKAIESKLYIDTALHKTYLLVVNKKFPKSDPTHRNIKIFPGETLNISRIETMNSGADSTKITGAATDSCWRFKSLSDHVSTYSYLSEEVNDNNFNPASIIAIQLEDGPIVKFNEENLTKMIGNDAKALKKIKKKDYYEAIIKYNRDVDDAQNKQ